MVLQIFESDAFALFACLALIMLWRAVFTDTGLVRGLAPTCSSECGLFPKPFLFLHVLIVEATGSADVRQRCMTTHIIIPDLIKQTSQPQMHLFIQVIHKKQQTKKARE